MPAGFQTRVHQHLKVSALCLFLFEVLLFLSWSSALAFWSSLAEKPQRRDTGLFLCGDLVGPHLPAFLSGVRKACVRFAIVDSSCLINVCMAGVWTKLGITWREWTEELFAWGIYFCFLFLVSLLHCSCPHLCAVSMLQETIAGCSESLSWFSLHHFFFFFWSAGNLDFSSSTVVSLVGIHWRWWLKMCKVVAVP